VNRTVDDHCFEPPQRGGVGSEAGASEAEAEAEPGAGRKDADAARVTPARSRTSAAVRVDALMGAPAGALGWSWGERREGKQNPSN
jgi:hypothetical protein